MLTFSLGVPYEFSFSTKGIGWKVVIAGCKTNPWSLKMATVSLAGGKYQWNTVDFRGCAWFLNYEMRKCLTLPKFEIGALPFWCWYKQIWSLFASANVFAPIWTKVPTSWVDILLHYTESIWMILEWLIVTAFFRHLNQVTTHKYPLYKAYIGISHRGTLVGVHPTIPWFNRLLLAFFKFPSFVGRSTVMMTRMKV